MRRSLDPEPFNRIADHPSVKPHLGLPDPSSEVDFTEQVRAVQNVCLLTPDEDGAYLLIRKQAGLYEAHTMALPSARGRPMADLAKLGFAFMFTATDAEEICTYVLPGAKMADRWAAICGFKETFKRGEVSFRSITHSDWVLSGVGTSEGEAFHDLLGEAGRAESHPDDPVHDAWVGATIMGCKAGNPLKAIGLYNRWASIAGYEQSTILSLYPLVVDTGDAILAVSSSGLEILKIKD